MRPSLLQIILGGFVLLLLAAVMLSLSQPPANAGRYEFDVVQSFEGLYRARPVPSLWVLRRQDPGRFANYSVYPLVGPGMQGLSPRAAGFDGMPVTLSGKLMYNGAFTAIEADESTLQRVARTVEFPAVSAPQDLGEVALRGEILDLKSYAGYQEPGSGSWLINTASNAIQGGIPAVLSIRSKNGDERAVLLLDEDGGSLGWRTLGRIGAAVEVRGKLRLDGGMMMIEVPPDGIRRVFPWQ